MIQVNIPNRIKAEKRIAYVECLSMRSLNFEITSIDNTMELTNLYKKITNPKISPLLFIAALSDKTRQLIDKSTAEIVTMVVLVSKSRNS